MKSCVLIGFLLCVALAISEAKKCNSRDDCEADECCVRLVSFVSPECKKLKQKNDICFKDINEVSDEGVYKFACPCAEGLNCKNVKEKNEDGTARFLVDMKNFGGFPHGTMNKEEMTYHQNSEASTVTGFAVAHCNRIFTFLKERCVE